MPPSQSAPRRFRCFAPAKINLGLRVVGRRPDGYHELESLFVPIDLGDEIALEVHEGAGPGVKIEVSGFQSGVPNDATNLAARAASDFASAAGLCAQIGVQLTKRIPAGAGLGGGSSDAGTVLRTLWEAFPAAVPPAELARIALRLGADVPFFLDPRPSWVTGVGEVLRPVAAAPALPIVLANPGVPLATSRVFEAFDANSTSTAGPTLTAAPGDRRIPPPLDAPGQGLELRWDSVASRALSEPNRFENDLEAAAVSLCPSVAVLLDAIRGQNPRQFGMSGSGSTVFGVFESNVSARLAVEKIAVEKPAWARVATTIESR